MQNVLESVELLQERLGYRWVRRDLLVQALTHSSYGNESGLPHSERLEFLGDSVLDLVTAEWLMANNEGWREGKLSQRRAELVCTCALAARARDLGVHEMLLVGKGAGYLRGVDSVLADAMEAIVGAAYQDSGSVAVARELALAAGILR